jgi:hypothetical protein
MVHLLPLPGSPGYGGSMRAVAARAAADARAIAEGGLDGAIVENYGDFPFFRDAVPAETVAAMALCVEACARAVRIPLGLNVLRNDARAALGLAAATGARFVRINVHVGAQLTDQGIIEGRAAETARIRASLCPGVAMFVDVGVKHSAPLAPRPIREEAHDAAHRGLADAIVVTGSATGKAASRADFLAVRNAGVPVLAGSGVTAQTARATLRLAHGAIVGTAIKRGGVADEAVDAARVKEFVKRARG